MKIAPEYTENTVHVLDASRAVDVMSSLLSPSPEAGSSTEANRQLQVELRDRYVGRSGKNRCSPMRPR